jgi:hypothetical protein
MLASGSIHISIQRYRLCPGISERSRDICECRFKWAGSTLPQLSMILLLWSDWRARLRIFCDDESPRRTALADFKYMPSSSTEFGPLAALNGNLYSDLMALHIVWSVARADTRRHLLAVAASKTRRSTFSTKYRASTGLVSLFRNHYLANGHRD